MNPLQLFRQSDRPARRITGRRPTVEGLEGRQLLSGIVGNHIGTSAMIQGNHIGTSAMIQGAHIGTSAMIQGAHIGTSAMAEQGGHHGNSGAEIIAIL